MGYTKQNGEYANTTDVDLSPAAALSANAQSNVIETGDKGILRLTLDATAVSASDTLDVTIEGSSNGQAPWVSLGTFTQVAAPGTQRKVFLADRFVRASYVVAGSAVSIAFTLKGEVC